MFSLTNKIIACAVAILMVGTNAAADERKNWMVQVGPANLDLADDAVLKVGGQVLPGAEVKTESQYTPTITVARYVADQFAASLTIGPPPRAEIDAGGTLNGVGRLANVDYGPAALTLQYHPFRGKRVDPYVGAGFAYMLVTNTQDGVFQNVEVENDLGAALQAGVNISVTDRYGVYFDVKKAFLTTQATGTFNGFDAVADVVMDPLVISAGASLSF